MILAPPWEVAVPEMITAAISILVACLANRYITTEFTAVCREYNQIHGVGTRGSHMCDFLRCLAMSQIPGEPDRPISHVLEDIRAPYSTIRGIRSQPLTRND